MSVKERLLEAGVTLLREQGIAALTQPRIARQAGVSQSHLTYYFPTRNVLLLAIAEHSIAQDLAQSQQHLEYLPPTLEHFSQALAYLPRIRMATSGAISVLNQLGQTVFAPDLPGRGAPGLEPRAGANPGVDLRLHRRYNPEALTAYNIVPGLLGVILTMTMVMMTSLAMTRERERGTFENLLATPATPLEVMTGKVAPYVLIGLIQVVLILAAARWLFAVPMLGSLPLLCAVVLIFICANLTLGITFSSLARNQLQAMQMTFFFFLPSMLLSGFMFPFRGMPAWAQTVGSILPLTHFLILVRGILLKGNGLTQIWPHLWPILAFMGAVLGLGLKTFRRTLD